MCDAVDFHGLPLDWQSLVVFVIIVDIEERTRSDIRVMTYLAWRITVAHLCCVHFSGLSAGGTSERGDCAFEPQGEGRVAAVVDGRSFRLDDGREIRLAGIERGRNRQGQRQDRAGGSSSRRRRLDAAWRRRRAGPLRPPAGLCLRGWLGNILCRARCSPAARRSFRLK